MVVRKTHLYLAIVVVVILAAFFAQRYQNQKALDLQKNTTIALCMASVERSSYVANGFRILAQRVQTRNHAGDRTSALNYNAVADSIISTFPGVAKNNTHVDRIEMFDGKVVFRIPDDTRDEEQKGCTQAFDTLPAKTP